MTSDYVNLWFRSPVLQCHTVMVNTGSIITALPCRECVSDCDGGYHTDAVFDDTESDMFTRIMDRYDCALGTWGVQGIHELSGG